MKAHPSVTVERVVDAVKRQETTLANPGFCLSCGKEAGGCEPDARKYTCESCGAPEVYGASELLMHMVI